MKKIIYLILIIFLVALASAELEKQYQIEIINEQGVLKAGKIEVVPSLKEIYFDLSGEYKIELVSYTQEILEENYFDISLIEEIRTYGFDGEESYSVKELNKTNEVFILPYHENAKEINIYDQDIELKLTIPVGKFSKDVSEDEIIGEKFVEEESEEIEDVSEQDEIEEKEIKEIETVKESIPTWKWILGFVGLLIIVFIVWVIVAVARKK